MPFQLVIEIVMKNMYKVNVIIISYEILFYVAGWDAQVCKGLHTARGQHVANPLYIIRYIYLVLY